MVKPSELTSKWKLQRWTPDTCDDPPCVLLELWDSLAAPEQRTHRIAAVERLCSAHRDTVPRGRLRWTDGNWKPLGEYLQYQRAWFLHLNHQEWLERRQKLLDWFEAHGGRDDRYGVPMAADGSVPGEDPEVAYLIGYLDGMPETIRDRGEEPATTGSLPVPEQAHVDGLERVYDWNQRHNDMKNQAIDAAGAQFAEPYSLDHDKVKWSFSGHGENRRLRINLGGQLDPNRRGRVQAAMDIQHGQGRITVEG